MAILRASGSNAKKLTAQLDGEHTIHGESERIDVDKIDFGFLVRGGSASIDNVKAYELKQRQDLAKSGV